jgi:fatty acid desaturase|tara:strand:- start:79 stop:534 length:456 start_codon:yes stop_codon:yes gene_type:complete
MANNLSYRTWFYFRQGWTTYFAFIFAAVNTLTVTYYLAIENIPSLQSIFPNFYQYALILVSVGIPLLVVIGYAHYKKTSAFKAEADIQIEANPHLRRILLNTEILLDCYYQTTELLLKLSKNEKLSDDEIKKLLILQKTISEHAEKRIVKE